MTHIKVPEIDTNIIASALLVYKEEKMNIVLLIIGTVIIALQIGILIAVIDIAKLQSALLNLYNKAIRQ